MRHARHDDDVGARYLGCDHPTKALLAGAGLYEIRSQLAILAVFSVVCLPLAFMVASAAINKAKRDGSLGVF